MKIQKVIKRLKEIESQKGNIEVFISDRALYCNHQHGEFKDFQFFKTWYETNRSEKEGILIAVEDESDSTL